MNKNKIIGDGHGHHVKHGKHGNVKAGPHFKMPMKGEMSKDMYDSKKLVNKT